MESRSVGRVNASTRPAAPRHDLQRARCWYGTDQGLRGVGWRVVSRAESEWRGGKPLDKGPGVARGQRLDQWGGRRSQNFAGESRGAGGQACHSLAAGAAFPRFFLASAPPAPGVSRTDNVVRAADGPIWERHRCTRRTGLRSAPAGGQRPGLGLGCLREISVCLCDGHHRVPRRPVMVCHGSTPCGTRRWKRWRARH